MGGIEIQSCWIYSQGRNYIASAELGERTFDEVDRWFGASDAAIVFIRLDVIYFGHASNWVQESDEAGYDTGYLPFGTFERAQKLDCAAGRCITRRLTSCRCQRLLLEAVSGWRSAQPNPLKKNARWPTLHSRRAVRHSILQLDCGPFLYFFGESEIPSRNRLQHSWLVNCSPRWTNITLFRSLVPNRITCFPTRSIFSWDKSK